MRKSSTFVQIVIPGSNFVIDLLKKKKKNMNFPSEIENASGKRGSFPP